MNDGNRFLLTLFLSVITILAPAQQFVCQNINFTKGLSGNSVWGITQDNQGYIWMATSGGVDRFDGNNFRFISGKNGLTASEAMDFFNNPVTGDVYVQMYAGKLSVIKNSEPDTSLQKNISRFYSKRQLVNITVNARQKSLFIYTDNFVWETDFGFNIIKSFPLAQKQGQIMLLFYRNKARYALLRTDNAELVLCRQVMNGFEEMESFIGVEAPVMKYNTVKSNSCLLFDSRNRIYAFDFESLRLTAIAQAEAEISGLLIDRDSLLWYGKNDGVHWLDLKDRSSGGKLLKGHIIGNIFEDRFRQIWISTITNGVYLISQKRIHSNNLSDFMNKPQTVHSFFKNDKYSIYGFTNNSFAWIHKGKTEFRRFSSREIFNRVINILSTDRLPLLAHDFGVFDLNTMKNVINGVGIKQFKPSGKNMYTSAGLHGLITYQHLADAFIPSDTLVTGKVLVFENLGDTASIYYAPHGQFILDYRTRREWPVLFHGGQVAGVSAYYQKHHVLYAIADNGIIYELRGRTLWPVLSGLFSENESLRKLFIDDAGDLHVISDRSYVLLKGYSRGNRNNKVVLNYKNGLSHTLINDLFVRSDTVYIAGNAGVSSFRKTDIVNRFPERVIFTQVSCGTSRFVKPEPYFSMGKNQSDLKIEYHTIDFNFPEQIFYEYRLMRNGEERSWSRTVNNSILFSDLQSGDYTFQILAFNPSNRRQATKLSELRFSKEPLLLENPLALACIYLLSLASAVWTGHFLMRRKARIDKKNQEVRQRITQLELLALRSQLDPHFIFNALNSIKDFIRKNDSTRSQKYLDDFSMLMRITLDKSKNRNILLSEEVNYLSKYLSIEQLRFNYRFTYSIYSDQVPAELIFIPSMMLQPFLENAIRHGLIGSLDYEGRVEVHFEMPDENYLRCLITDNGKGLAYGKEDTVKGVHALHIIKDRIKLYNDSKSLKISFEIYNRRDGKAGVCVDILLPILYHEND